MNTKFKAVTAFFVMQLNCIILGQDKRLPPIEILEQLARERASIYTDTSPAIIYEDGDFDPPPVGQVMKAHWKHLKEINHTISENLQNAPDDATGKKSPAYAPLQAWKVLFDHFIKTNATDDLLALVPGMVEYRKRPWEQKESIEMEGILYKMNEINYYVVEALGRKVVASNGVLNAADLNHAVDIFLIPDMVDISRWDPPENPMPLDMTGVLIIDPAAVVTRLKSEPWEYVKVLTSGGISSEEFFSRYIDDKNQERPEVLKAKYKANQATIDAKYNELKAWVKEQKKKAEDGK